MPACTSTSKDSAPSYPQIATLIVIAAIATLSGLSPHAALAADGKKERGLPTDDDFSTTPYTEYGSFNSDEDEDAETRFLQYGRLFGVSVGVGSEGNLGNRGRLWTGGFPLVEVKVHYWFDFQMALDLGFSTVAHSYTTTVDDKGNVDVHMYRVGANLKYYFDTKNLSAPISFANPYILGGISSLSKTEFSDKQNQSLPGDTALALNAGIGLEFAIRPRKAYFAIEAQIITAKFKDTDTADYQTESNGGIPDLSGPFYTVTGSFLFTW